MSANNRHPINISFFMVPFLSLFGQAFTLLITADESFVSSYCHELTTSADRSLSCLVNAQAGKKLQEILKILGIGYMLRQEPNENRGKRPPE
jgi:hypothetical protein